MSVKSPNPIDSPKAGYESELLTLLMSAVALGPLLWLVHMIATNYIGTPFSDTWSFYYRVAKYMNGDSSFWEFILPQYNEARPAVPRLILFLVHSLNRSLVIDVVLNVLSAVGAAGATLLLLRKTNPKLSWLLLLAVSILFNLNFFSIAQWKNWNWHAQLMMLLPNLFFAIGWLINISSLPPLRRGLLVSCCCALSTFSFANGLFQWFLLIPIAIGLDRKVKVRLFLGHFGAALLCIFLYFHGYKSPAGTDLWENLSHPIRVVTYFFAWLGSSLSGGSFLLAEILGGIVLLAFLLLGLLCLRDRRTRGLQIGWLPWLSMGCYALISGAVVALGRSHSGLEHALTPRYCAISQWLIIASIGLGVTLIQQSSDHNSPHTRLGITFLGLLVAAFVFFSGRHEVRAAEAWREFAESMHFQKQSFGLEAAEPGQLWTFEHPDRRYVEVAYRTMRKAGFLRDFYRSAQILPLLTDDYPGASAESTADEGELEFAVYLPSGRVRCQGWSPGGNPTAGDRVLIVLLESGRPNVLAVADSPIDRRRRDLERKPARSKLAGFDLEFRIPKLEPSGNYRLAAFHYGKGERSYRRIGIPTKLEIFKPKHVGPANGDSLK